MGQLGGSVIYHRIGISVQAHEESFGASLIPGYLASLSLVEDGLLRVAFDISRHFEALVELANRYDDRRPDLANLCLIRMSELYPRHSVITVAEADFLGLPPTRTGSDSYDLPTELVS